MKERTTLQDLLNQKIVYSTKAFDTCNVLNLNNDNQPQNYFNFPEKQEEKQNNEIIDSLFKKGVEFLKSEKYCCAAAFFETILSFQPEHIKAQLNLGVALYQKGEYKKALDILEQVLKQEPDNDIAICNIRLIKKDLTNF